MSSFKCKCNGGTNVVDSRSSKLNSLNGIRRIRKCKECGKRFSTFETIIELAPNIAFELKRNVEKLQVVLSAMTEMSKRC